MTFNSTQSTLLRLTSICSVKKVAASMRLSTFTLLLLASEIAIAEALLQILPTRVVLLDKERSGTLTLVNHGDSDTSYRMFFRNIRMSDTGKFQIITDSDDISEERFADSMLRFSPRRITVPSTGKQTIRIVARKPQDLEEGEYRSHMVFRRLPNQQSILDEKAGENLTLSIQPVVEVTIPIIIRHGELEATLSLSKPELFERDGENFLKVTINREGNRSLYGNLKVTQKNREGKAAAIAQAKGISVYYPNERRIFEVPLEQPPASGSQIKIIFEEDESYGGTESASIDFNIQ